MRFFLFMFVYVVAAKFSWAAPIVVFGANGADTLVGVPPCAIGPVLFEGRETSGVEIPLVGLDTFQVLATWKVSRPTTGANCVVSISGNTQICPTGGSVELTATAGFNTYVWSNSANGSPITVTQAGTYTVTATDAGGCTATASYTVSPISVPAPTVGAPPILCVGGISVVGVTPNPAYTNYDWSNGASGAPGIYVTAPGTYTVTITTNQGCTVVASGTVNTSGNTVPNATYSITPSPCSPPPVTLSTSSAPPALFVVWVDPGLTTILAVGPTYVATQPGVYVAVRTYFNTCVDTVQVPVNSGIPPMPMISGPTQLCAGQSGVLSAQSGFNAYQWSGSGTGNQPNLTINGPGTYTVTVWEDGCPGSATRVVTPAGNTVVNITASPYLCNGQLELNATPGFAAYQWSNNDNTPSTVVSQSGTYRVTVTTANGCTGTASFNAVIPPTPTVSITGPAELCPGQPGTLTASTGLVNYQWSSSQTGRIINITIPNTYTVTASNAAGCTATASFTVNSGTPPSVDITGPTSLCNGTAGVLEATPGLSAYRWSNNRTTASITVNSGGTYTVTATAANGCTGTASFTLTNLPAPSPSIQVPPYDCDGSQELTATGNFAAYNWSSGQSDPTISVSTAGTYTVTVTNADGCTGTVSRTVNVPPAPLAEIDGPPAFCMGTTVVLRATPGFVAYSWSNGSNTANVTVAAEGHYTVTVRDASGCTATATHIIAVNIPTPVSITGPNAICNGAMANLTATPGFAAYRWSNNATTQQTSVNTSGTYQVTATDDNGCTSTASYTLAVNPNPTVSIQTQPYACNGTLILVATNGQGTYLWSNNATGNVLNATVDGTYTVTATNAFGCTSSTSQVVAIPIVPTVSINGPTQLCSGAMGTLVATSGFANYNWSEGSIGASISVGATGTYTVTATAANGCTASSNFFVNVSPTPNASIGGNTGICAGNPTTLSGPLGSAQYQWSGGETTRNIVVNTIGTYTLTVTSANGCTASSSVNVVSGGTLSPSIQALPYTCNRILRLTVPGNFTTYTWSTGSTLSQINANANGTYSVTVTAPGGCVGSGSIDVAIPPVPTISVTGDDDICQGQTTTLRATVGFSAYRWSTGATTSVITVDSSAVYVVTATDAFGCSTLVPTRVIVHPLPPAGIVGNPNICVGGETILSGPANMQRYLWSDGSGNPSITVAMPSTLGLTVTDVFGCSNTAEIVTQVVDLPQPTALALPYDCDGTAELETGGGNFAHYGWSNGDTLAIAKVSASGTYTVTVTDANGCTGTASATTNVPPAPVASINGLSSVCVGDSALWAATAGFTQYAWSNGQIGVANLVLKTGGTYTLTVTDAFGCTASATRTFVANALPAVDIAGKNRFCMGASTVLNGPAGLATYRWSDGSSMAQINVSAAGTFSLTVTDTNGCSNTANIAVNMDTLPRPTVAVLPYPCDGTQELTTASGFDQYRWNNGVNQATAKVSASGTYTVTVTDANGCTGTASANATIPPVPVATINGPASVCAGDSALWAATAGFTQYAWSNGQTGATDLVLKTGGTYTLTVTDAFGCTASATRTFVANALPVVDIAGKNRFCAGASTVLNGPTGLATYRWSDGSSAAQINVSAAGTFSLTVADANGCSNTANVAVNMDTLPRPTVAVLPYPCDGTRELTAASGFDQYRWNNGVNQATAKVSASGTYTVTVTDANGCTGTASASATIPPVPVASINGPASVCAGDSTLWTAAAGFTQYAWSNGQTGATDLVLKTGGTYTLTVTDAFGCTASTTRTFVANALPAADIAGKTRFCAGTSTVLGGPTGLATYRWSDGSSAAQINVSAPGTFSLTVTDANGCSNTANIAVNMDTLPRPTVAVLPYPCDGTRELTAASGFDQYRWNNGVNQATAKVSASGTYIVTVTDANGCTGTASANATIPPIPVASINGPASVCAGDSALWAATAGFTQYAWSNGQTGATDLVLKTGGTYTLTVTDAFGCTASATRTFVVNASPSADIAGKNRFCAGTSTVLNGPTGLATYRWSDGSSAAQINVSAAGTFSLTVTDANGCSNTANIAVNMDTLPRPTVDVLPYPCDGTRELTAALSFDQYRWNNGVNQATAKVSASGTYTVTVTDANGCTGTASANATIPPVPVASINGPASMCAGDSALWTAAAGFTQYAWSNGQTGATDLVLKTGGTYTLTVTDAFGCTASATRTFVANALPAADIAGKTRFCAGASTVLGGPAGLATYRWSDGSSAAQINVSAAGTFSLTVTDANGCSNTANIAVNMDTLPRPTVAVLPYPCDGTRELTAASGFDQYRWNNGVNQATAKVSASGTYTVTVTDANGCTGTASANTTIPPAPTAAISGADHVCLGDSVQWRVAAGYARYSWSNGQVGNAIFVKSAGSFGVTVTDLYGCTATGSGVLRVSSPASTVLRSTTCDPAVAGQQTRRLQTIAGCDSIVTTIATLEVLSLPWYPEPACPGQFEGGLSLGAGNGVGPYTLVVGNQTRTIASLPYREPLIPGVYNVSLVDARGCSLSPFVVTVPNLVTALSLNVGPDLEVPLGTPISLRARLNFPPQVVDWRAKDTLLCANCTQYAFEALQTQTLIVSAINPDGCAVRDTVLVQVQKAGLYVPNAFAPDSDGPNRFFEIMPTTAVDRIETLEIFDRWGNLVFAAPNAFVPGEESGRWDGLFRGEAVPTGVYVYWMRVLFADGTRELLRGDITVVR